MNIDYRWDFLTVAQNWNVLTRGFVNTIELALICLVVGMTLGLFVGAARYSRHPGLNWPATAFIEVFRNTPAMVLVWWFAFAFPIIAPIQVNSFLAATCALSLNTAAFSAEIFRGGIQSISPNQWEAGRALGMSYPQLMRRVILPQAVRRMVPAFMNRSIELTKMTTLASTIAFAEALHEAKTLSAIEFNPIEAFTTVALIFFVTIYPLSLLVQRLELRLPHGR
ncbi:MAG: amino acid ABC transporter permease [Alphaproteobacteria bacterium]